MVPPTLAALLAAPVTVASPTSSGPLAVFLLIAASEPSFDSVYGAALANWNSRCRGAPGEVKVRVYNP
jgi:hypothetical protein